MAKTPDSDPRREASLFARYQPDAHSVAVDHVVQELELTHLERCVALAVERDGGQPSRWRTSLERSLHSEDRQTFIAVIDNQLAGYGTVGWLAPAESDPDSAAPQGWYLLGLIVDPRYRRQGVGHHLTGTRMAWIQNRAPRAWYFVSSANRASIDLHAQFGFQLAVDGFALPGVNFTQSGRLYVAQLPPATEGPN